MILINNYIHAVVVDLYVSQSRVRPLFELGCAALPPVSGGRVAAMFVCLTEHLH